jgi:hypothetical protein
MEIIASYLPQYFPIPENDNWHEPGFTEWTNVTKAKPLFPGHYQPKLPGELGIYDLRVEATRIAQANLARQYGVTSFCFWHYWFGNGKKILNFQIESTLNSKEPDFPFCLGWANESWYGIDHGVKNRMLIEQLYPSHEDYEDHFYYCLKFFQDPRYTRINGAPLFMIYKPMKFDGIKSFIDLWQGLAKKNQLPSIYFIGQTQFSHDIEPLMRLGFSAVNTVRLRDVTTKGKGPIIKGLSKLFGFPQIFKYSKAASYFIQEEEEKEYVIPTIIPNWDHTPRTGNKGTVLVQSNPAEFERLTCRAVRAVENKKNKIIFIKSWNEWGEGNYLEPDRLFKRAYLEALKNGLMPK